MFHFSNNTYREELSVVPKMGDSMGSGKQKKPQSLVSDKQYEGKYVAMEGKKVIASGANVGRVIESARGQGFNVPSIVFVPKKDISYIY